MQQRFADAKGAYRSVLAHGAPADRKNAALALAVIDWKIDGDTARAMRDLRPFIATSPALTMVSRARLDAHNVAGARAAARAALVAAHDAEERRAAAVALADAAAFPYERSCIDSAVPRPRVRGDSALRSAIAQLRATVDGRGGASRRVGAPGAARGPHRRLAVARARVAIVLRRGPPRAGRSARTRGERARLHGEGRRTGEGRACIRGARGLEDVRARGSARDVRRVFPRARAPPRRRSSRTRASCARPRASRTSTTAMSPSRARTPMRGAPSSTPRGNGCGRSSRGAHPFPRTPSTRSRRSWNSASISSSTWAPPAACSTCTPVIASRRRIARCASTGSPRTSASPCSTA